MTSNHRLSLLQHHDNLLSGLYELYIRIMRESCLESPRALRAWMDDKPILIAPSITTIRLMNYSWSHNMILRKSWSDRDVIRTCLWDLINTISCPHNQSTISTHPKQDEIVIWNEVVSQNITHFSLTILISPSISSFANIRCLISSFCWELSTR